MSKKQIQNKMVIYQAKNGAIELRGDFSSETIWATQAQIAGAFDVDVRTVNEHVKNIYKSDELPERATVRKFRIVQKEGKREIAREIQHYNLDMILSVGYRVNSKKATAFRQWATKVLRQHITKGYTINPKTIKRNYAEFQKAVENVKALLPAGSGVDHASVVELISAFADTWLSLQAYDKDALAEKGTTRKVVELTTERLAGAIADFKSSLLEKGDASRLFGQERQVGAVGGIVGSVMQTFGGRSLYPTVEEKAAHLLYFMVKNHPFVDGNKRSGAYAFIWFLNRAGILDRDRITPATLTALTLFIAESDPRHKEKMVRLILQLLKQ